MSTKAKTRRPGNDPTVRKARKNIARASEYEASGAPGMKPAEREAVKEAERQRNERIARQREQWGENGPNIARAIAATPINAGVMMVFRDGVGVDFDPTDLDRDLVYTLMACGVPPSIIAAKVGCSEKTLARCFADEINMACADANAVIAQTLFAKAVTGDTTAITFWLKARAGWADRQAITVANPDGTPISNMPVDLTKLSVATLRELMDARAKPEED